MAGERTFFGFKFLVKSDEEIAANTRNLEMQMAYDKGREGNETWMEFYQDHKANVVYITDCLQSPPEQPSPPQSDRHPKP